ncbi:MAG TPA: PspC domain-containing protein [Bryobacteraceae bacterium]|nr:PspC domain-containing protein [Bryobacteraceae bacterium]
MFCTQCGTALDAPDRFCRQCGHATGVGGAPRPEFHTLTRDMQNKKIAGVCAGFARYFDVDVTLIRVIWLALAFCTGVGFIAYVVAWVAMPKQQPPASYPATEYVSQHS